MERDEQRQLPVSGLRSLCDRRPPDQFRQPFRICQCGSPGSPDPIEHEVRVLAATAAGRYEPSPSLLYRPVAMKSPVSPPPNRRHLSTLNGSQIFSENDPPLRE